MRVPLAWRNVVHERGRAAMGILGVAFAIMLIFLQLGFYYSVVLTANLIYDDMDFDVALVSREYGFLRAPRWFPRRRLFQAMELADVVSAQPVYIGHGTWRNPETRIRSAVILVGFNPDRPVFRNDSINAHLASLRHPDSIIVDTQTRPKFGARFAGDVVEINGRDMTIVEQYQLGTSFLEDSIALMSDQNMVRITPGRRFDQVGLGLIRLRPGAEVNVVAAQLRELLPRDVHVWTRDEFRAHEVRHWVLATSTGFIFGSGVVVAMLVGLVILYQTIATQIMNKLNEYATLKAIGYRPGQILRVVLEQACFISVLGYFPGWVAALGLYAAVHQATFLPMVMTTPRLVAVFVLVIGMSLLSGLLAYGKVHTADPADLF